MNIDDLLAEVSLPAIPQQRLDLQDLTRSWVAERVAPELLPWPAGLMERVLKRIAEQIAVVEDQTGTTDPKVNFSLIIIQTELERWKFLVRSYVRARLKKIDIHPQHILALHTASPTLLSPSELQYLTAHQALLTSHYASSFLSQFPASLQRMDDTTGGVSMIDKPDDDTAVFVRALRDVGEVWVEGTGSRFELKRGDVSVVRWSAIRGWVLGGDVELI